MNSLMVTCGKKMGCSSEVPSTNVPDSGGVGKEIMSQNNGEFRRKKER